MLLARARCVNPEDCVQQAFVRLASQEPAPNDPLPWLVTVVRNEAISQTRSESRRRRREQSVSRPAWLEPDSVCLDRISVDEVTAALKRLSVDHREVIVARIWNGLTFRQMSDAFGLPRATVHRRYESALERLRAMMNTEVGTKGIRHER